jgi:hypothetical protein
MNKTSYLFNKITVSILLFILIVSSFSIVNAWTRNYDINPYLKNDDMRENIDNLGKIIRTQNTKFYGNLQNKTEEYIFRFIRPAFKDESCQMFDLANTTCTVIKECKGLPNATTGYWECNVTFPVDNTHYRALLYANNASDIAHSAYKGYDLLYYESAFPVMKINSSKITEDPTDSGKFMLNVKIDSDRYLPASGFTTDIKVVSDGETLCELDNFWLQKKPTNEIGGYQFDCEIPQVMACKSTLNLVVTLDSLYTGSLTLTSLGIDNSKWSTNLSCVYPVGKSMLYRFWSEENKSHFYTSFVSERNSVIDKYTDSQWKYEGVAYKVADCNMEGTSNVYRFWSDMNKKHFYTNSLEETNHVMKTYSEKEWKFEGKAFCAYSSSATDRMPVYRFWSEKNKGHFYTASESEKKHVDDTYSDFEWKYEGIAYYVSK